MIAKEENQSENSEAPEKFTFGRNLLARSLAKDRRGGICWPFAPEGRDEALAPASPAAPGSDHLLAQPLSGENYFLPGQQASFSGSWLIHCLL